MLAVLRSGFGPNLLLPLASVLTLQATTPPPSPAKPGDERELERLVERASSGGAMSEEERAALLEEGALAVRRLAERAAQPGGPSSPACNAGRFLCWFEPSAAAGGEDLLPLLRDPDEMVRAWCSLAMANVVPPVVDVLEREMGSADRDRRLAAVRAARGFVEHQARVAPVLAPLVADADPAVRRAATWALAGLAPTSLSTLFGALASEDAAVRVIAAEGIEKSFYPWFTDRKQMDWAGFATWHGLPPEMGLDEESNPIVRRDGVAVLARALADANEEVRAQCAIALCKLGADAAEARPALEAATRDGSATVKYWAARALERCDPDPWARLRVLRRVLLAGKEAPEPLGEAEVSRLAKELDDAAEWSPVRDGECAWSDARDARFEAVCALATRGWDLLMAHADGADDARKASAVRTLTAMRRESDARIEKLVRILDDEMGEGEPAAKALVALGAAAMPALEFELLRFPRFPMGPPTYVELAHVLVQIGEPAVPSLAFGLEHWRAEGRVFCAQSLLELGPRALPALPCIVSAWRSVGDDVRVPGTGRTWDAGDARVYEDCSGPCSTEAMARLGPAALPSLLQALEDAHAAVRARAAASLGAFGREAATALGALTLRLEDEQSWVARSAADAILRIAPRDSPAWRAADAKRSALDGK